MYIYVWDCCSSRSFGVTKSFSHQILKPLAFSSCLVDEHFGFIGSDDGHPVVTQMLDRVLRLLDVGSKRFLTNKVRVAKLLL